MKTILAGIGLVVVVIVLLLFAVCNDDNDDADSYGRIQIVASHDYRGDQDCYRYGDCRKGSGNDGDYRDDNRRGGISPGPFDRSPVDIHDNRLVVCFPFSRCDGKDGGEEQPPAETPMGRLA